MSIRTKAIAAVTTGVPYDVKRVQRILDYRFDVSDAEMTLKVEAGGWCGVVVDDFYFELPDDYREGTKRDKLLVLERYAEDAWQELGECSCLHTLGKLIEKGGEG